MKLISAAILVAVGEPEGRTEDWLRRLESVGNDRTALLDLGRSCEQQGIPECVLTCYEKVLRLVELEPRPRDWCATCLRLAKLDIAGNRLDVGYRRLSEVVAKCTHRECSEQAQVQMQELGNELTRKQLRHFEDGKEQMSRENWEAARKSFLAAYDLVPKKAEARAFISPSVILRKLSQCQAEIDEAFVEKARVIRERPMAFCVACTGAGFPGCAVCSGEGKVRKLSGLLGAVVTEDCKSCGGDGHLRCTKCGGLGCLSPVMSDKERKVVEGLVDRMLAQVDSLRPPLASINSAILSESEPASLNYLRAVKGEHRYGLCVGIRDAFGTIPFAGSDAGTEAWKQSRGRAKYGFRANFLLGYACEYAEWLEQFDFLHLERKVQSFPCPDWALLAGQEYASPELLSAFPDERRMGWEVVKGVYKGFTREGFKGRLRIAGDHHVQFFVWRAEARAPLKHLENSWWRKSVAGLTDAYPFEELEKQFAGANGRGKEDHVVLLGGRFLRNRLGYPRNWFEVWRCKVGMRRAQEEIMGALKEPVKISGEGIPIKRFAVYLEARLGLKVEREAPVDESLIDFDGRGCPAGLLIDEVARVGLGVDWYYAKGAVAFCGRGMAPMQAARDIAAVVEELKKGSPGGAWARRARDSGRRVDLPEDAAGLRVVLQQYMARAAYDEGGMCLDELLKRVGDSKRHEAAARLRAKLRLFHELTGPVRVSQLADATKLAKVRAREGGEPMLVKVLDDTRPGVWEVQEAYGIRETIDSETFRRAELVPGARWREERKAELEKQEEEFRRASGASKASRAAMLYRLARNAKTHGLLETSTAYLKELIVHPGFGDFLRGYDAERHEELATVWRVATGQEVVPPPRAGDLGQGVHEPGGELPEAPSEEPVPLAEDLAPEKLLERAQSDFVKGRRCYRKALWGENAKVLWRRAGAYFDVANRAVEKYLQVRPDDGKAEELKRQVFLYRHDLLKDMQW